MAFSFNDPPSSPQAADTLTGSISPSQLTNSTSPTKNITGRSINVETGKEDIEDVLEKPFLDFSHEEVLAKPYENELRRDIEFHERKN